MKHFIAIFVALFVFANIGQATTLGHKIEALQAEFTSLAEANAAEKPNWTWIGRQQKSLIAQCKAIAETLHTQWGEYTDAQWIKDALKPVGNHLETLQGVLAQFAKGQEDSEARQQYKKRIAECQSMLRALAQKYEDELQDLNTPSSRGPGSQHERSVSFDPEEADAINQYLGENTHV